MKHLKKKKLVIAIGAGIVVLLFSVGTGLALNGYFGGGGAIASDTSTRGLVGYWKFDEGTANNLLIAGTTTNNFDGKIDDARVYSYERSAAEILRDYNAGLSTYFR